MKVNLATTKRMLKFGSGLLAVASAIVIIQTAAYRPSPAGPAAQAPTPSSGPNPCASQPANLDRYALIWQRELRKPIFDAPPAAAASRPQLALKLLGTVVEPGYTYGMFTTAKGEQQLVGVGQRIDGAEVKSIEDGSVTVLFGGETLTLKVEKDKNQP